jgi:hypothetical protein
VSYARGTLAGLVRAWVDIVAELPPIARMLLLVLFLATLALYVLGIASMVLVARLPSVPADEPVRAVIRPTAVAVVPAVGIEDPEPTETPPPEPSAVAAPQAAARPSPIRVGGVATPTEVLEPTPTQDSRPVATPRPTAPAVTPPPTQPAVRTPPPSPSRTPPPAPAPARPPPPAGSGGTLGPGGTFAKTEFAYPGDRSVYTVNVHVEPDDAGLLRNAGFIVYGPNGDEVIRGGAQPGRRPNVSANVITTRPGRYVVQVQNYDPARSITYRLEIVAGPPG